MYYTQIRANALASALTGGLDGLVTYTATPGQTGFPDLPDGTVPPACRSIRGRCRSSQQPARNITIRAGQRDFYKPQFANYGLNFDLLPNYPDEFVNPRSQVMSIGAEREIMHGLFAGADYVHQHWTDLDRTVDLNAPSPFDRTAPGQTRTVAAANATRPILPVNGGVRKVNVLMNLGVADYDGLQTQISYRGSPKIYAAVELHAVEGDQHHRAGRQRHRAERREHRAARRRGARTERGRSAPSRGHHGQLQAAVQHHRRHADAVRVGASVQRHRPASTTTATARTTTARSSTATVHRQVGVPRHRHPGRRRCSSRAASRPAAGSILLRLEGFNLFNHGNILGRAQTTYGDTATVNPTFGQVVARRHGDQRAPGAREHRPAADVPVPGEVYVLVTEFT